MNENLKIMANGTLVCLMLLCALVSPVQSHAQNQSVPIFSFSNYLKLGDNNEDVQRLQVFLNKNSDTRVAVSGVGSVGNESTYFGNLTKSAVMRFQEKYKQEILVPSGLTFATGFVGPATIKKINSLLMSSTISVSNIPNTPKPPVVPSTQTVSMPIVSSVSKVSVSVGDTLVITGKFSGVSAVHFGDNMTASSKVINSTEIDAVVPNLSGITLVWVSNEYGDSRADFPMFIFVGSPTSEILSNITVQNNIIHNKAIDPANQ